MQYCFGKVNKNLELSLYSDVSAELL